MELSSRLPKFLTVGGIGVPMNLGLLYLLTDVAGLYYLASAVIAFFTVTMYQYLGNNYWTFSDRKSINHLATLSKFVLVLVVYNLVYFSLLAGFTELLNMFYILSATLAILIAFIPKYILCWGWTWKN